MTFPQVTGGYHDAGDHVKFGFPMASMTVRMTLILILSQAEKILCKNDFSVLLQTIVAWGANSFYEGYEKAGQLEWWVFHS